MIPDFGPSHDKSAGEVRVYALLRTQLGDEFTIIHSLPWLAAATKALGESKAVTGEIDFLVVHAELGVLAIEVKGGAYRNQGATFVCIGTQRGADPIEQVRSSTHGLARWLGADPRLRLRIGYLLVFPHSDFMGKAKLPALHDPTVEPAVSLIVDRSDLDSLAERVSQTMRYWRSSLKNPALGEERKMDLIQALCPGFDGTPNWAARVAWDGKEYLRLTQGQAEVVARVDSERNTVITGWPGTGKTLILIEAARRWSAQGKKVLLLTFNSLLCAYIQAQLASHGDAKAMTWHAFCRAHSSVGKSILDQDWFAKGCLEGVRMAAEQGRLTPYDVLLIDEAQAFDPQWLAWLRQWHGANQIVASCDETQVFEFEGRRTGVAELCETIGADEPFLLTSAIRSPRAVVERLKAVMKPPYQLSSPRDMDPDAIDERLQHGSRESVESVISSLVAQGVKNRDIVVLSKFKWSTPPSGAGRCATLSSFRGSEAPVIIVSDASDMSDVELFCAYSRATSLCVALYSPERLALTGADCGFKALFLAKPERAKAIEQLRSSEYPGELVSNHASVEWFDLASAKIGWAIDWGCWLVEVSGPLSKYWVDFLALNSDWAVCHWSVGALRVVHMAAQFDDPARGGCPEQHTLKACSACDGLTPHRESSSNRVLQCARCEGILRDAAGGPDEERIRRLRDIDMLVRDMLSGPLEATERKRLPLFLAAGAAMEQSVRKRGKDCAGVGMLDGRSSYSAAVGFIYSWVNLSSPGKRLIVRELAASLYNRYSIPIGLDENKWLQDMQLAASMVCRRGTMVRLERGTYRARR